MNVANLALGLALASAPAVDASEAGVPAPLTLRSKSAVAAVLPAPRAAAPFRAAVVQPELDLEANPSDPRLESKAWTCDGERSLCYDPNSRRVIYKPARALMPEIPGLRRENISVKRDRITFKYSF